MQVNIWDKPKKNPKPQTLNPNPKPKPQPYISGETNIFNHPALFLATLLKSLYDRWNDQKFPS